MYPPDDRMATIPDKNLPNEEYTSSQAVLRRFDPEDGRLVRAILPIHSTNYITISHVWGNARWQHVQGVGEVLVSDEKAKFMSERLPILVGQEWFWMDVLCIDQRDKNAAVTVTQHIPAIFRNAHKTIVVRNSAGFRECPEHTVENADDNRNYSDPSFNEDNWVGGRHEMMKHIFTYYDSEIQRRGVYEAILGRLWVLQEIMLSKEIKFVRCDAVPESNPLPTEQWGHPSVTASLTEFGSSLRYYLKVIGWDDEQGEADVLPFLFAFLHGGSVSRNHFTKPRRFPENLDFWAHRNSHRKTGNPRDFILAILPQFEFYIVPENAKNMSFQELFVDCFHQGMKQEGWTLAPLLMADHIDLGQDITSFLMPTTHMTDPVCLGDVAKLFLGATVIDRKEIQLHEVAVKLIATMTPTECFKIIYENISDAALSPAYWDTGPNAELGMSNGEQGVSPQDEFRMICSTLFELQRIFSLSDNWEEFWKNDRNYKRSVQAVEGAILLIALLLCELGESSYGWAKKNLRPVAIQFPGHGQPILGLISTAVVERWKVSPVQFFVVEADEMDRYILLATMSGDSSDFYGGCLLPKYMNLDNDGAAA